MMGDPEEDFYSYADYLEDRGREKGRQEGHKEGCVATMRSMLLYKFELPSLEQSYEARLQAATPDMIDRYARRVLTADSVAAVFDD